MYGKIMISVCLLLMGINAKTNAQTVTVEDLTGKWTLTKIEVVQRQNSTDIDTQSYTPASFEGKIYFEKIECRKNGQIVYSGMGDEALLSTPGMFHMPNNTAIVFQNPLIGFTFDFVWANKPTIFVLEQSVHVNQQSGIRQQIRFFYQKYK